MHRKTAVSLLAAVLILCLAGAGAAAKQTRPTVALVLGEARPGASATLD